MCAWRYNSRLLRGDVVAETRELRQQPGLTVHTWGSSDLLQTLLKNDLADEYLPFILPVLLPGMVRGRMPCPAGKAPITLYG